MPATPPRKTEHDPIHPGAREIVRQSLGLEPGQDLVIFCDESTLEPATALAVAADSLAVPLSMILVPISLQRRIPHHSDLSLLVQSTAQQARAILTCVNATPDCLPFRERVLETQWSARTRIGHMPGATLDVLDLATVDMAQITTDCHCLELPLARARELELITHMPSGEQLRLIAGLGGWDRLPVASDGIIIDGAWGNVPSGETYIAPLEGTAEGSVVIDGSLPGRVMGRREALVLRFSAGRLVQVEPVDSPAARWLDESQIQKAKAQGDLNWSNLAEIGIGVNPAIPRLTGNMLLDGKAAGTAHIALGNNSFMGGRVDSVIHCDLVMRQPTIVVDGQTLVDHGELQFRERDWRENYARVRLEAGPLASATQVSRSGVQVEAHSPADRRLRRVLRPEPGRVSGCFVGDDATARLAGRLYAALPAGNDWVAIRDLAARANLDVEMARHVLHVMWEYRLVNVRPGEPEGR